MDSQVRLREVGLRDGLQLVKTILPTAQKKQLISAEYAAGVREIEVSSMVPPAYMPQFADAEEVVAHALGLPGLVVSVLIPNLKGAQRAIACGAHKLNYVISASQAHNRANVRRTTEDSLADFERIAQTRDNASYHPIIAAGIATAFGCTIEGPVSPARVVELAAHLADAGADEIALADTVGYANPAAINRLCRAVTEVVAPRPVSLHLHDTRGLGLANLHAGLEAGIRIFDASLGGLGGCPFAPGASGNIDMEDAAFMLEEMGFRTGIDLPRLIEARKLLAEDLPGETLYGHIAIAGLPRRKPADAAAIS